MIKDYRQLNSGVILIANKNHKLFYVAKNGFNIFGYEVKKGDPFIFMGYKEEKDCLWALACGMSRAYLINLVSKDMHAPMEFVVNRQTKYASELPDDFSHSNYVLLNFDLLDDSPITSPK